MNHNRWSVHLARGSFRNWGFGIYYYREHDEYHTPARLLARIFVIDLVFFRITINRWEEYRWI